jgi:hypothetical protein
LLLGYILFEGEFSGARPFTLAACFDAIEAFRKGLVALDPADLACQATMS